MSLVWLLVCFYVAWVLCAIAGFIPHSLSALLTPPRWLFWLLLLSVFTWLIGD